jgi:hypothetical protein
MNSLGKKDGDKIILAASMRLESHNYSQAT